MFFILSHLLYQRNGRRICFYSLAFPWTSKFAISRCSSSINRGSPFPISNFREISCHSKNAFWANRKRSCETIIIIILSFDLKQKTLHPQYNFFKIKMKNFQIIYSKISSLLYDKSLCFTNGLINEKYYTLIKSGWFTTANAFLTPKCYQNFYICSVKISFTILIKFVLFRLSHLYKFYSEKIKNSSHDRILRPTGE